MLSPSANEAIATARIVCDLDAGIVTVPFNRDFLVISFIATFTLRIVDCTFTRNNEELKEVFDFTGSPYVGYG